VTRGAPRLDDLAIARVDAQRRHDIMRNHTATHLLHAGFVPSSASMPARLALLVAPARLRFDFTHPRHFHLSNWSASKLAVNQFIWVIITSISSFKPLQEAIKEGAIALFGEKYGETVRQHHHR